MQTAEREKAALFLAGGAFDRLMEIMPRRVRREIEGIIQARRREAPSEIRLRAGGVSALALGGRSYPLLSRVTAEDISRIMDTLCRGALYACRDEICQGYVSFDGGIRVGIIGEAGYDGGRLVGVYDIGGLVFRIPTERCAYSCEVAMRWRSDGERNLIIIAPPSGGKTTLLRGLAREIGSGREARRVVVIDTRREFITSDYASAAVDILRGYERAAGIEQAIRTASAEIIIVDEIHTAEDVSALIGAARSGVRIVATAHGRSVLDVMRRSELSTAFAHSIFENYVILSRDGGSFCYEYGEIK